MREESKDFKVELIIKKKSRMEKAWKTLSLVMYILKKFVRDKFQGCGHVFIC